MIDFYRLIKDNSKIPKILGSFAFFCISYILYILITTPLADGYELSIYNAYPIYFWFAIILSLFSGILILIHQSLNKKTNWWKLGFIIIFICISLLILTHSLRGYPLSNPSDLNYQHRLTENILNNGYISDNNFYPMMHILTSNFIEITSIKEKASVDIITITLFFLFIISFYLLSKKITESKKKGLIVLSFASIPIFQMSLIYYHPSGTSILFFPLIIFLFHQIHRFIFLKVKFFIILLLFIFFITFFHPVTSIFLIITFLSYGFANYFYKIFINKKIYNLWGNYVYITLISIISFIIWYSSFSVFRPAIINFWKVIVGSSNITAVSVSVSLFSKANLTLPQSIEFLFFKFGDVFIYLLLSVLLILFITKKYIKKEKINTITFTFAIIFLISFMFTSFLLFSQVMESDPIRISRLLIVISILFIGLTIGFYLKNNSTINIKNKKLAIYFIVILLFTASIISTLNFYRSPRTFAQNYQTTYMELEETKWHINYKQNNSITLSTFSYISGYQLYFLNRTEIIKEKGVNIEEIPPHFGYNTSKKTYLLIELTKYEDGYMVITKLDEIYPQLFPKNVRENIYYKHNESDFIKLSNDNILDKIYHNGEVKTWRINSKKLRTI